MLAKNGGPCMASQLVEIEIPNDLQLNRSHLMVVNKLIMESNLC